MSDRDASDEEEPTDTADESITERFDERGRHHRLDRHPTSGSGNSLQQWTDAKHPLRVAVNYAFIVAARHSPSLRSKSWLLRRIGVDVGSGVSWGLESTPDVFWPERITVGNDAIIGYDATLLCHEFLQDEYRLGDIVIEDRAMIGAGAVVLPGVTVGEEARVAANSLVTTDVPPRTTVAGVPAEVVSRMEDDTADGNVATDSNVATDGDVTEPK